MPVRLTKLANTSAELARQCVLLHFPTPTLEYPFAKAIGRQWRFDVAFLEHKIAVEIEGGLFVPQRSGKVMGHSSAARVRSDMVKYAEAAVLGWTVIRQLPESVGRGDTAVLLERLFKARRIIP